MQLAFIALMSFGQLWQLKDWVLRLHLSIYVNMTQKCLSAPLSTGSFCVWNPFHFDFRSAFWLAAPADRLWKSLLKLSISSLVLVFDMDMSIETVIRLFNQTVKFQLNLMSVRSICIAKHCSPCFLEIKRVIRALGESFGLSILRSCKDLSLYYIAIGGYKGTINQSRAIHSHALVSTILWLIIMQCSMLWALFGAETHLFWLLQHKPNTLRPSNLIQKSARYAILGKWSLASRLCAFS